MRKTIKAYRRLVASAPATLSFENAQPGSRSSAHRRFSQSDADGVEMCLRGLEHLASESVLRRRLEEQSSAVQAVLSLQQEGRQSASAKSTADVCLAMRYSALTRSACDRAHLAAKADEAEAG